MITLSWTAIRDYACEQGLPEYVAESIADDFLPEREGFADEALVIYVVDRADEEMNGW